MAGVLLGHGALPHTLTQQGVTALHLAAQEGHAHMAALLLSKAAQPNTATKVSPGRLTSDLCCYGTMW